MDKAAAQNRLLGPAQIAFSSGISVSGAVLKVGSEGILLRLDAALPAELINDRQFKGSAMSLTVESSGEDLRGPGVVLNRNGLYLLLALTAPAKPIARRAEPRYECKLAVVYREWRAEGSFGVWHEAQALDVTLTGMRMWVPGGVRFPGKVEFQIRLPDAMLRDESGKSVNYFVENTEVIRATGKPRHGRFTRDGNTTVGVRFDSLSPAVQRRLSALLDWLKATGAKQAA